MYVLDLYMIARGRFGGDSSFERLDLSQPDVSLCWRRSQEAGGPSLLDGVMDSPAVGVLIAPTQQRAFLVFLKGYHSETLPIALGFISD